MDGRMGWVSGGGVGREEERAHAVSSKPFSQTSHAQAHARGRPPACQIEQEEVRQTGPSCPSRSGIPRPKCGWRVRMEGPASERGNRSQI